MGLDDRRQAMADALVRVYEHLFIYLPEIREVWPQTSKGDSSEYQIMARLVEPAVQNFAAISHDTTDVRKLCETLMRQVHGLIDGCGFPDAVSVDLRSVFARCQTAVLDSPHIHRFDPERDFQHGRALSRDCYRQYKAEWNDDTQPHGVLDIHSRNGFGITTARDRTGSSARVTISFSVAHFAPETYLNLPFYFLHEWFSHVHAARAYAEEHFRNTLYGDGWLMYAAQRYYKAHLSNPAADVGQLSHPLYRADYLDFYIHREIIQENSDASLGYRAARRLVDRTRGDAFFWHLTFLLAAVPYDCLIHDGILDFHTDIVLGLDRWLRSMQSEPESIVVKTAAEWHRAIVPPWTRDTLLRVHQLLGI